MNQNLPEKSPETTTHAEGEAEYLEEQPGNFNTSLSAGSTNSFPSTPSTCGYSYPPSIGSDSQFPNLPYTPQHQPQGFQQYNMGYPQQQFQMNGQQGFPGSQTPGAQPFN